MSSTTNVRFVAIADRRLADRERLEHRLMRLLVGFWHDADLADDTFVVDLTPPHHRTTPRTGSIANQLNHEELAQLHAMRKPVQRNQSKRDSVPLGGRTVIGGLQLDGVI